MNINYITFSILYYFRSNFTSRLSVLIQSTTVIVRVSSVRSRKITKNITTENFLKKLKAKFKINLWGLGRTPVEKIKRTP